MSDAAPLSLVERRDVTQAVLERYRSKPFSIERRSHCLAMFREQLVGFGYSPPPIPNVRSVRGAKLALKKAGFVSMMALLDSMLERIAPARMLIGDVALLPGEAGDGQRSILDTIVIHVGGGKVLGWYGGDDGGLQPIVVTAPFLGAWRIK